MIDARSLRPGPCHAKTQGYSIHTFATSEKGFMPCCEYADNIDSLGVVQRKLIKPDGMYDSLVFVCFCVAISD